jgi:hypothetical protein
VIPKAAPTVAAVGQLAADWVVAGLAIAVVEAVVATAVAVVVGTALAAVAVVDGVPLLEPQAPTIAPKTRAVTASLRGLLCDMRSASFRERRLPDLLERLRWGRHLGTSRLRDPLFRLGR